MGLEMTTMIVTMVALFVGLVLPRSLLILLSICGVAFILFLRMKGPLIVGPISPQSLSTYLFISIVMMWIGTFCTWMSTSSEQVSDISEK